MTLSVLQTLLRTSNEIVQNNVHDNLPDVNAPSFFSGTDHDRHNEVPCRSEFVILCNSSSGTKALPSFVIGDLLEFQPEL